MAIQLTSDPIVTLQNCRDILRCHDDPRTIVLINSVSAKFLKFTNRVRINQGVVAEFLRSYDHKLLWLHAPPVTTATHNVVVEIIAPDGTVTKTYSSDNGDLLVDELRGRVMRPGCLPFEDACQPCSEVGVGNDDPPLFPSFRVSYDGGFLPVPGDITMSAFEQIQLDNERLKGAIAMTVGSDLEPQYALNSQGILQTVADVWKPYRIMI